MRKMPVQWILTVSAVLLWARLGEADNDSKPRLPCNTDGLQAGLQDIERKLAVAVAARSKKLASAPSKCSVVDRLELLGYLSRIKVPDECNKETFTPKLKDLESQIRDLPEEPYYIGANESSQFLLVSLDRMPVVRSKLNVDEVDTGRHLEVEWDPSVSGPLVKRLTLPAGTWQFSFWREPTAVPGTAGLPQSATPISGCAVHNATDEVYSQEILGSSMAPVRLQIKKDRLPNLKDMGNALQQGSYGESGTRGLDATVPAAAQDVFRIFAQIAYERASSKAMEVLSNTVVKFVCDLKLPKERATELGLAEADVPVLPATCQVVKSLRIQELGSSAHALLQALLTDVAELSTSVVLAQLDAIVQPKLSSPWCKSHEQMCLLVQGTAQAVQPVFHKTLPILIEAATERRQLTTRDANLILVQLSQIDWTQLPNNAGADAKEGSEAVSCAFRLGFAILGDCQQKGGCDAREVAERVTKPGQFYTVESDCKTPFSKLSDYFPDLEQFVSRGLEIVFPAKGVDARTTIRSSVDLIFDVTERLQCAIPVSTKARSRNSCESAGSFGLMIKDLRRIAIGLIDRDAVPVMLGVTAILQRTLPVPGNDKKWTQADKDLNVALVKAGQLLTALSSYAATYATAGDAKSVEAQQAARKKAVESLIDAATKRSGRDGAWVVSLGANVGFSGGLQWIDARSDCREATHPCGSVPQLTLPMGLAIQYLPDLRRGLETKDAAHRRSVSGGFHLQLSPIDLAQFIALDGSAKTTDNVRWSDFVMVGLQAGAIVGKPDANFLILADVRWIPTVFSSADNTKAGALRVGLTLSYYIPFFDFN